MRIILNTRRDNENHSQLTADNENHSQQAVDNENHSQQIARPGDLRMRIILNTRAQKKAPVGAIRSAAVTREV